MAEQRPPPTIDDIARHAGVSAATVSRVLNGHASVHHHLRDQVLASLAALQYEPNHMARSLRARRSLTVGVVVPDILNAHFVLAVRAIQDTLAAAGYTALLCNSDRDEAKERTELRTLLSRGVDGVILAAATQDTAALAAVVRERRPVVLMDRDLPDAPFDVVSVDCERPTCAAVLHLAARGRRRIAHLAGPEGISTAAEKLAGYRRGLAEAGLPPDPDLIVTADYTEEGGAAASAALLDGPARPDAVVCANHLVTQALLRALAARRRAVPDEIAVVGIDDMPWTTLVSPPLTVVAQPVAELGRRSAALLIERMGGLAAPPRRVRLEGRLLIRRST